MKDKILAWIKNQRGYINDPDGNGEDGNELDEGSQGQLQLLDELEEFITKL